jgi:molecular chaperone HtpG
VQFPIELNGKRLNTIQAIWARPKAEVKEEEYTEFYHYLGHDTDAPLLRLHFTADAPLSIQALLFVPRHNLESLGLMRTESEVHLYCRKVLIEPRAKGLLPEWLRFLKGVVDSEDLPLNISRERMQDSTLLQRINKALTSRFLKFLDEQAEKEPEKYAEFYGTFNRFLKEGMLHEFAYRTELGKLLRFESSALEKGKQTSLAEYVKRMPAEQKEIYYLLGYNREAAESSPYFEVFRARNAEVLFLYDPMDEFVMDRLMEFEGKTVMAAEKGDLALADADAPREQLAEEAAKGLAQWMKDKLGNSVEEVRVSKRLVDSPAVVLERDKHMTSSMRQILRRLKREEQTAPVQYDLEINPRHPVITRLEAMRQADASLAGKVAEQVLDNARLAAGLLDDPRAMLKRMNELMEHMLKRE